MIRKCRPIVWCIIPKVPRHDRQALQREIMNKACGRELQFRFIGCECCSKIDKLSKKLIRERAFSKASDVIIVVWTTTGNSMTASENRTDSIYWCNTPADFSGWLDMRFPLEKC